MTGNRQPNPSNGPDAVWLWYVVMADRGKSANEKNDEKHHRKETKKPSSKKNN